MKKIEATKLPEQLKRLLQLNGSNQKQLAEAAGVTPGSVTGWMNGAVPSGATLHKIADYFAVTTDELLTGQKTNYAARKIASEDRIMLAKEISDRYPGTSDEKQQVFELILEGGQADSLSKELKNERDKRQRAMAELLKAASAFEKRIEKTLQKLGED